MRLRLALLLGLLGSAALAACTVDNLVAAGRPCDRQTACGPGTICDEVKHICVARPGPDAAGRDVLAQTEFKPQLDLLREAGDQSTLDRRRTDRDTGSDRPEDRPRDQQQSCPAKYGSTPNFKLCQQTQTSCVFVFLYSLGMSCNDVCSSGGGTCIKSQSHLSAGTCSPYVAQACTKVLTTAICTCTR